MICSCGGKSLALQDPALTNLGWALHTRSETIPPSDVLSISQPRQVQLGHRGVHFQLRGAHPFHVKDEGMILRASGHSLLGWVLYEIV